MEDDTSWSATPSPSLLNSLLRGQTETRRWIARLHSADGTQIHCAIGNPSIHTQQRSWSKSLYLPPWILAAVGLEGIGEEMEVEFVPCERLEKAKNLTLKVLGEMPEGFDLRDILEDPLSQLGVLQEGQILPLPVLEGHLLVVECEPAGQPVFLDGHEVGLHIEEEKKAEVIPVPPFPLTQTAAPEQKGILPPSILSKLEEKPGVLLGSGSTPLSPAAQAFLARRAARGGGSNL